jgi:hypothetical protein
MKKLYSAMLFFVILMACSLFLGCSTLESVQITQPAAKLVYGQGQDLDLAGLVVIGTYSGSKGEIKDKPIQVSSSNVSGYDKHQVGEQTVIIRTGSMSVRYTVTVKPLVSISVTRSPAKVLYKQGEALDWTGLIVTGTWEEPIGNGAIPVTDADISGYDRNTPGSQRVTITVESVTAAFTVTVKPLASIAVTQSPSKLNYRQGEPLDITGLVVTGAWDDIGTEIIPVTGENVSGYNANTLGRQTIAITVAGKTASFTVMVKALSSIEVTKGPDKTIYELGESLDLAGLEVLGTYNDLTTEKISVDPAAVSRYDSARIGDQVVLVTVDGKVATFTVTVRALLTIDVRAQPRKAVYKPGEELDLTGLTVVGTYSDTSNRILAVDAANISGYDKTKLGAQTITVTVQGKSTTFTVTVL